MLTVNISTTIQDNLYPLNINATFTERPRSPN